MIVLWFSVPAPLMHLAVLAAMTWNNLGTGAPRIAITVAEEGVANDSTYTVAYEPGLLTNYGALGMTLWDGTILLDPIVSGPAAYRTLVHEFGHVLGLQHDCTVPSVMCDQPNDVLFPTAHDAEKLGGYRTTVAGVAK